MEQEKSPIQSYALRLLEYDINASECLPLAEAPPTPDRLNDFGILKVPDLLSEVIYLNTVLLITCLFTPFCSFFSFHQSASKPDSSVGGICGLHLSDLCPLWLEFGCLFLVYNAIEFILG